MIYSVSKHKEVPVSVSKKIHYIDDEFGEMTRYSVYDDTESKLFVGYVDLKDTEDGAKVLYIKSEHPNSYKHFGQLADQIEVEHCLNRGLNEPYIFSVAARDTYVKHFKRGKRFVNKWINAYLGSLTRNLQKGEKVVTKFLGYQKMYMPKKMVDEIKEKIKIAPILKGIK